MGQQGLPPGYRFSPTDEELVVYYLKNRACGKDFHQGVIAEVDIYKYEPWELPEKATLLSMDPVWYFFNAQDKRHSHTARINRTTSKGYWKATGKDRKICCGPHVVGIKKTLIYYEGRAPSGKRTDWIMHEFKLDEESEKKSKVQSSIALCRIRRKGGPGPRNGEQYGASLFNEGSEWGEDAEEDADDKLATLPESQCEVSATIIPCPVEKLSVHGGVVSQILETEGCASHSVSQSEGLANNTDQDLQAFLESFYANDTESRSGPVFSFCGSDESFAGHQPVVCDTNADLHTLVNMQCLVDAEKIADILHPSSGEEQILEELLGCVDENPVHMSNAGCNERMILHSPSCNDGILTYNDHFLLDNDVGGREVLGDFIELDDLNSPLDDFVMQPPSLGGYYTVQENHDQLDSGLDEVEYYGTSSDLLHTQGSAARRIRMQIPPSSVQGMHVKAQCDKHPKVQYGENFNVKYMENAGGNSSQDVTILSSESEEISSVVKSLPKTFLSKHMSRYMVSKYEEVPPLVFVTTSDEESSLNDSKRQVTVFNRPQNKSSVREKSSPDGKVGLESRTVLISEHPNKYSCKHDAGIDCESGASPTVVTEVESSHAITTSPHGISVMGELENKVKSLTLGRGLAQLDSNLSTIFNNNVLTLGKPVVQLVPSTNPYRSLKRSAMASLLQLVVAVVFLFLLFLGIHMLTKYVLSAAARA